MMVQAQVEGLQVHVRCGVTEAERALLQTLLVDIEYYYEAGDSDELASVVDYAAVIEGVASILEDGEFKLLETAVQKTGEYMLQHFPAVMEVAVVVTKSEVPISRALDGVSIEGEFMR